MSLYYYRVLCEGLGWVRYHELSFYKIVNMFLVWQLGEHRIGGQAALGMDLRGGLT